MQFKVGDKVIFKDENIEGFVTKIINDSTVEVTDVDGFGIPALTNQIIKVGLEPTENNSEIKDVKSIQTNRVSNFHQALYLIATQNSQNWDVFVLNNLNCKMWVQMYIQKKGDWVLQSAEIIGTHSFAQFFHLKFNEISDFKEVALVVLPMQLAQKELPVAEKYLVKISPKKFLESNEFQKIDFLNTNGLVFLFQKITALSFTAEDVEEIGKNIKNKPISPKNIFNTNDDFLEDILDLHIEKLHVKSETLNPFEILDYQIKAADRFITQAKRLNRKKVVLVHGKGKGVLKNKIKELVEQHKLTFEYSDFNSGETIIKL
jgi:hypothetical protein